MENQPKGIEWSKDELAQFKKFWEGPIGKKYIERMEETKKQLLQHAMGSYQPDDAFRHSLIANGFDSILQDIQMLCSDKKDKKEDAAKEK